jgi:hypothetical protein
MKFATNDKTCIHYDDKTIEETGTVNFLGLQTGRKWKKHIEYIILKPSSASQTKQTAKEYLTSNRKLLE